MNDFWWLPARLLCDDLQIRVGHCDPPAPDEAAHIRWHSLTPAGNLAESDALFPLTFIHEWRNACKNENVFRSLKLTAPHLEHPIIGPFVVDIDGGETSQGAPDIADAAKVTKATVQTLRDKGVGEPDMRVLFTGHKGFCIEVRPESLELTCSLTGGGAWREKLQELIDEVRNVTGFRGTIRNHVTAAGTMIDHIFDGNGRLKHPYLRLSESLNVWLSREGRTDKRVKRRVRRDDLEDGL
ncbi:MAG: hypothetical protein ACYDEB_01785 [Dehalococcoidia bacterium]